MSKKIDDPWDDLEIEIENGISGITLMLQNLQNDKSSIIITTSSNSSTKNTNNRANEDEFISAVNDIISLFEDLEMAFEKSENNPDLFSIATGEMQRRREKIRLWGRMLQKPKHEAQWLTREKEKALYVSSRSINMHRIPGASHDDTQTNNEFIGLQMEEQKKSIHHQDEIVDRLHSGVLRVKEHAVNIRDELHVQDKITEGIAGDMTKLHVKIDSVIKKVAKLLDDSSDCTKYIIIIVLFIVLVILIYFLLS
eukprot:Tbor_TRINITY_DN1969_c0_g2::TRINITY_DN1969_c0_g2_i1::g.3503::m.3503/K08498/STX6; syntaxin 6